MIDTPYPAWRHRWALLTVAATLVLIFAGGLVTSTGSGLAVPDWPLSYGMLMPPMVGGVFYEHGHRMVATFVGLLTLVLALWTARSESHPGVRRLAWAALGLVVAQGLLGGLTVKFLLPTPVSVLHACVAQTFFCVTIAMAYVTSREWLAPSPAVEDGAEVRRAAFFATGAVFVQLILGAVMRHTGAGLAVPDFPRMLGAWIPPGSLLTGPVVLHLAHRGTALVVLAMVARLFAKAARAGDGRFSMPAAAALALTVVQIALGAAAVLTAKAVLPTTAHVATGAAILGLSWFLSLRAVRLLRPRPATAVEISLGEAALT